MTEPKQPDHPAAPNEGKTNPGTAPVHPHAPNGIPDNMDGKPKGLPNDDRHETETAPKQG